MKEDDEIETNVKTFFEKRNCYSGYSGYFEIKLKKTMLLFLKVVTKGREFQKSRLNNSLTN